MKVYRKRFLQNSIALAILGATMSFSGYTLASPMVEQSQTPVVQNAVQSNTLGFSFKNAYRGGYYGYYGPRYPLYYGPYYGTGHWVVVPYRRWVPYYY
jgi:hypothetical protein